MQRDRLASRHFLNVFVSLSSWKDIIQVDTIDFDKIKLVTAITLVDQRQSKQKRKLNLICKASHHISIKVNYFVDYELNMLVIQNNVGWECIWIVENHLAGAVKSCIALCCLSRLFFSPRTRILCGKTNFVFLRIPPLKFIMKAITLAAILLALSILLLVWNFLFKALYIVG